MRYDEEKQLELNKQLSVCMNNLCEAQRCEKLLESTKKDLGVLKVRWDKLKEELEKEEHDVEKLQKLTFSNLVHTIMKNKVEKLDKEKQEALTAKLRCDSALIQLEECRNTVKRLEDKRKTFYYAEEEYKKVLDEKRTYIAMYMPDKWDQLKEMIDEVTASTGQLREIKEAIQAGNLALGNVRGAITALESAKSWGTWDMLGGGLIATIAKHDKMDEAQNCIYAMQNDIRKFSKELKDVDMYMAESDLDLGSFLRFADYFFDGFFVDWTVQSRIHDALDHVTDIKKRIENILVNLRADFSRLTKKKDGLDGKIKELIESA